MSRSRTDEEEMALSVRVRRCFNRREGICLQQIAEVLLSLTALESLGNVAIYEKRLREDGQVGKVNQKPASSLCPSGRVRL